MTYWWQRDDLCYTANRLSFGGRDVEDLARKVGTPLYLYSGRRLKYNLDRLGQALAGVDYRIFYAMKSNRFAPLLTYLKTLDLCGVDVCSPGELVMARQCGFEEDEISFTGTSLSEADLDCLQKHEGVWVNCDSLSSVRRLGARCPGRQIGLRVNPGLGIGYAQNELLRYAGAEATKFGIYRDQFDKALQLADASGLAIKGLHVHAGCGYLSPQLPVLEQILAACMSFVDKVPDLQHINIGGGLGIPLVEADMPLDLAYWRAILEKNLRRKNLQIRVEPGDFIAKDAGMLVLQVNTVEQKGTTTFVGVDGGFNIHIEPAFYRLPLEVVPCRAEPGAPRTPVTIAGNINEALDILATDIPLPAIAEGDYLAFLNAGGYGAAMSSNHCMRGDFRELLLH